MSAASHRETLSVQPMCANGSHPHQPITNTHPTAQGQSERHISQPRSQTIKTLTLKHSLIKSGDVMQWIKYLYYEGAI